MSKKARNNKNKAGAKMTPHGILRDSQSHGSSRANKMSGFKKGAQAESASLDFCRVSGGMV